MNTKHFGNLKGVKILDDKVGTFEAVFSTLNVVDYEGDVTIPGAIEEGQAVKISAYNHSSWNTNLPVGRGTIHEVGNELVVRGEFFLDTIGGAETYKVVKKLNDMQEWSYGYDVIDSEDGIFENTTQVRYLKKVKIYEVSPVLLGAGIDTRVTNIKSGQKQAIPSHTTDVVDQEWKASDNVKNLKADQDYAYYKKMYAWVDPEGDRTKKSSYKFPHHEVSTAGDIGAANIRACMAVIAALNGARGGTTIPDSDRKAVWNHVAKHLRDGDFEPSPLKSDVPERVKYVEHLIWAVEALGGIIERSAEISKLRGKDDKTLSLVSQGLLKDIRGKAGQFIALLDELIAENDLAYQEVARYMALKERLKKYKTEVI